jgi:carbamoyltransferase
VTGDRYVLGISAYHGDASAALLRDGILVAAVAEERLRRVKHWAGFPALAIQAVLRHAGVRGGDVSHVALARDSRAHLVRKATFALRRRPSPELVGARLRHARITAHIRRPLAAALGVSDRALPPVQRVEHHQAHLASAFLASPYAEAACCAVDGFGDFVSTSAGVGRGTTIAIERRVFFPHSLGVLYTAVTQYLGFPAYGDEFKVMALAAYGRRSLVPVLRRLITLTPDGGFALDLTYFRHAGEGAAMEWEAGYPSLASLYAPALEALLGPRRLPGETLTERHRDIACAVQAVFEDALMHVLAALWERTRLPQLCLAGGCALNAVANARIPERTRFREVFVPPAAGDDGTAVGAALDVWHRIAGAPRASVLHDAAYGPDHTEAEIAAAVERLEGDGSFAVVRLSDAGATGMAADIVAGGGIVGWYQGRSEWGARALGNRSIVADPRCREVRDRINALVKGREAFRPLAPSILWDAFGDYFDGVPDAFMTRVASIRPERCAAIPAVAHVDGTARVHAVRREANPAFYRLIEAFGARSGVPILLNTSFNESEPIVDTPAQAVDCFVRTGIDALVMESSVIRRVR